MNPHLQKFIRASSVGLVITVLSTAAAFVCLASSFIRPKVELHRLFHLWQAGGKFGIGLLVFYGVLGLAIDYFYQSVPDIRAQTKFSTRQLWVLKVSAVLCLLLLILSPFLYVYPSGNGWVTATKVSTDPITEAVAREYLWRGIRMWSGIAFWPGLGIAFLTGNLLAAARSKLEPSR